MSGGLLIADTIVDVPGVAVIGPHDAAWSHLSPGDCRPRQGMPRQIILHRTIADDPDDVREGAGPPGGAERTAEFWQEDPAHSGAHIVVGSDGVVACLADLVLVEAYHATVSNPYSIGIELHEQPGGVLYDVQLQAAVAVVKAICETLGIQMQVPRGYFGKPLERMADGGTRCYGIFGHRDNTTARGRWDPGDEIFHRLLGAGAEAFDFDQNEDRVVWMARQRTLNEANGEQLAVDGLPGPATWDALKRAGYRAGLYGYGRPS